MAENVQAVRSHREAVETRHPPPEAVEDRALELDDATTPRAKHVVVGLVPIDHLEVLDASAEVVSLGESCVAEELQGSIQAAPRDMETFVPEMLRELVRGHVTAELQYGLDDDATLNRESSATQEQVALELLALLGHGVRPNHLGSTRYVVVTDKSLTTR